MKNTGAGMKLPVTCGVDGCKRVAILQLLYTWPSHPLNVNLITACEKHYKAYHNPKLERRYLGIYKVLGSFGVEKLDDYLEKKLRSTPE